MTLHRGELGLLSKCDIDTEKIYTFHHRRGYKEEEEEE